MASLHYTQIVCDYLYEQKIDQREKFTSSTKPKAIRMFLGIVQKKVQVVEQEM